MTKEAVKYVVDIVFHFTASPEVRVSTVNPKVHYNENILFTFNLLETMRERGVNEMVFASSSSVNVEPSIIPVDENHCLTPISVYGATKAACENLIHAYSRLYGVRAIVLRYANVTSPRIRHGIVFDLLIKLKQNNKRLEVLGDGTQTISYMYIDDAIGAPLLAWRNITKPHDIYNVSSNDWIEVKTVVITISNESNFEDTVTEYKPVLHGVSWPSDVKKVALDIRKLKELSYQPKLSSVEAVRITTRHLTKELNLKSVCGKSSAS